MYYGQTINHLLSYLNALHLNPTATICQHNLQTYLNGIPDISHLYDIVKVKHHLENLNYVCQSYLHNQISVHCGYHLKVQS